MEFLYSLFGSNPGLAERQDTLPYSKSTVDRYLVEAEREGYIKEIKKEFGC